MTHFKYSEAGLELTEKFEGLRLEAYQDSVGVWTIGYVMLEMRVERILVFGLVRYENIHHESC